MSIKHPKGRRMDAFDWFIGDSLILACCRIPASLIRRVHWQEFYLERQEKIYQRRWIQERNSEFYSSIFPLEFRFFACNAPMICIGHIKLVSSNGIGSFIVFKSLYRKNSTDRDGENHLQFPWNVSHRCWQKLLYWQAEKVENFCAFSVVYLFREHNSFRSTGHVAMVRFKFQLTDVENECY